MRNVVLATVLFSVQASCERESEPSISLPQPKSTASAPVYLSAASSTAQAAGALDVYELRAEPLPTPEFSSAKDSLLLMDQKSKRRRARVMGLGPARSRVSYCVARVDKQNMTRSLGRLAINLEHAASSSFSEGFLALL